jgi:hypothetical protein
MGEKPTSGPIFWFDEKTVVGLGYVSRSKGAFSGLWGDYRSITGQ